MAFFCQSEITFTKGYFRKGRKGVVCYVNIKLAFVFVPRFSISFKIFRFLNIT